MDRVTTCLGVQLASSQPLKRIAPSTYEALRSCRLRVAYTQALAWGGHTSRPPLRLGAAAHRVLDRFVSEHAFRDPMWEDWVDRAWDDAIDKERQASLSAGELSRFGPPERCPNFELKRARLLRLAERLRDILDALPGGTKLETEVPLSAYDGRLFGIADVVVRGNDEHEIIDYKTGSVVDRQSGEVNAAYRRQLQIYARLESERVGTWPQTAYLLPFEGRLVQVAIDTEACRELASVAIALLDDYNALAPGPQPASAAPGVCDACQFVARCAAFWRAYTSDWDNDLMAVAGRVTGIHSSPIGGVSVDVSAEVGPCAGEIVTIRNISAAEVPAVAGVRQGSDVLTVGLRDEADRGTFRLLPWGSLYVPDADVRPETP